MELVEKLNKKFVESYSKLVADLNKNIYPAAKQDSGNYEAPIITIGPDGGALMTEEGKIDIPTPAKVSVELKEVKPFAIIYSLAIPRSEAEIADTNPAYFKYLFDKILEKALANYQATVGGPEHLRFGSHYVKMELLNIKDGADQIELRLNGAWASEKSVG